MSIPESGSGKFAKHERLVLPDPQQGRREVLPRVVTFGKVSMEQFLERMKVLMEAPDLQRIGVQG